MLDCPTHRRPHDYFDCPKGMDHSCVRSRSVHPSHPLHYCCLSSVYRQLLKEVVYIDFGGLSLQHFSQASSASIRLFHQDPPRSQKQPHISIRALNRLFEYCTQWIDVPHLLLPRLLIFIQQFFPEFDFNLFGGRITSWSVKMTPFSPISLNWSPT